MGRKKQQKSKQEQKQSRKKQRQIRKKHRGQRKKDAFKNTQVYIKFTTDFNKQLRQNGLQLRDVIGDGNCLFRSISDQIQGQQSLHELYRKQACKYISQNSQFYKPFIDEDEQGTIDQYVVQMLKDGEWGGNLQLQALAEAFNMNIVLHRRKLEDTIIQPLNFITDKNKKRFTIHLAYFQQQDFEHYTSIRILGDQSNQPAIQSLQTLDQYRYLNKQFKFFGEKKKQEDEEEDENEEQQLIRKQLQQLGIDYQKNKKKKEKNEFQQIQQVQIKQPFPGLSKNKKCKCGSKESYKNCCYKAYQKQKALYSQSIYC